MNLIEVRNKLKANNIDCVIIMKYGNFYRVFNEDSYIIWYLKKYKIHDNRIGFPINVIENVKQELNSVSVSFIIYDKNLVNYINIHNQYEVVLKLAKKQYEKEKILDKLKKYDCINEIREILNKYERINNNN